MKTAGVHAPITGRCESPTGTDTGMDAVVNDVVGSRAVGVGRGGRGDHLARQGHLRHAGSAAAGEGRGLVEVGDRDRELLFGGEPAGVGGANSDQIAALGLEVEAGGSLKLTGDEVQTQAR